VRRSFHSLAAVLTLVIVQGCSDDEIVFRDRPVFNPPPDASSGFLGYFKPEEKLTSCGNCHVGTQAEWETTAHSGAYETLATSGHDQPSCYGCHTVNQRGNAESAASGWDVVQHAAYHDVQCESCHGEGYNHVQNPDASQPIPSLDLGTSFDQSCAECHSGTHHPFAEEWSQSKHAQVVASPAGRAECAGCHRGQAILEAWGVDSEYLEKDSATHLPITCGVCHDPHSKKYEGQLRFPVDTVSPELHLCARCHDRRTAPDPSSSHGLEPHSPETALLLGDAGWFPPGGDINQGEIVASHGTAGNPKLCATCHVNRYTVTDQATGAFLFQATGHLFKAVPCVDVNGIPTTEEDCSYTTTDRSFLACATTGCHATPEAASSALLVASTRIQNDADDLHAQLLIVDPNLEDAGGEIDPGVTPFTVAEGALFNYYLATFGGRVQGSTAHNPFLTEALLLASIQAVEDAYGVPPPSGFDAGRELRRLRDRTGI
jgi:predicted CXXCH cytochrome family protein